VAIQGDLHGDKEADMKHTQRRRVKRNLMAIEAPRVVPAGGCVDGRHHDATHNNDATQNVEQRS